MNILKLVGDNPGAMVTVLSLFKVDIKTDLNDTVDILNTLVKGRITGTDIYVLDNDICSKDFGLMAHLCREVPLEELKIACSKQDYSGKTLLKKYIDTYIDENDRDYPEEKTGED